MADNAIGGGIGSAIGSIVAGPAGAVAGLVGGSEAKGSGIKNAVGGLIDPKAPTPDKAPTTPTPDNTQNAEDAAAAKQRSIRGQAANMLGGGSSLSSSNQYVARNVLLGS